MNTLRSRIRGALRVVGLEEPARRIWSRRPNWRLMLWNAGYRIAGDELPIPPTSLIQSVTTGRVIARFLHSGLLARDSILYVLRRNRIEIQDLEAILDFGCGCGRIMRHWRSLTGPRLHGTDYNPKSIDWCQRKLGHVAEFRTNKLAPPLDCGDAQYGFIYAYSVFTHLPEDLQQAWIQELARALKPGGFLLITVHGDSHLHQLSQEEQREFQSGQLVVIHEDLGGTNFCGAYHPEQYVRHHLARGFEVVDFVPVGARDADQDIYLLRKPGLTG